MNALTINELPQFLSQMRIDELRAKLKARDKQPGYEKNCEEIRAEIAKLEARDG